MGGKITAIIAAAGSGTRMGGKINKVFMPLGEGTVIGHTAEASEMVVIHDGARSLILPETVTRTIMDAHTFGAAAAGVLCKDSLKRVNSDGFIEETIDRQSTYLIQTPQIFRTEDILKAHEMAIKDGFVATDDCALYEKYIGKIKVTEGSYENIKLTTPEDMIVAENILKRRNGY